ncbi:MAG: hypothetical protein WCB49_02970 [Gammaproteobacteria bacterium]
MKDVMRIIVSTLALASAVALAHPALAGSKVRGQFTVTVTVVRPCSVNDSLEVSFAQNGKLGKVQVHGCMDVAQVQGMTVEKTSVQAFGRTYWLSAESSRSPAQVRHITVAQVRYITMTF